MSDGAKEPHETTYLRGWNEGIERAVEIVRRRASGYEGRATVIFNGRIMADELKGNAREIEALADRAPAQSNEDEECNDIRCERDIKALMEQCGDQFSEIENLRSKLSAAEATYLQFCKKHDEKVASIRSETIESCAKIAENNGWEATAAQIRDLKDIT